MGKHFTNIRPTTYQDPKTGLWHFKIYSTFTDRGEAEDTHLGSVGWPTENEMRRHLRLCLNEMRTT